jgi:hypothetical protein
LKVRNPVLLRTLLDPLLEVGLHLKRSALALSGLGCGLCALLLLAR